MTDTLEAVRVGRPKDRVQFRAERSDAADGGWLVVVEKIGHRDGFY